MAALPPGYEPPPGKSAKLRKSLYGLRQSPSVSQSAFHSLIEGWLLKYWFKAIGNDQVTFLLERGKSRILLSMYVDDGIVATNDKKLYDQFLKDLS
eukprot:1899312-Rhodomonas_salina.1